MEHQRDQGGIQRSKLHWCLDADVSFHPFPTLSSAAPYLQSKSSISAVVSSCPAICLADGAGAECCHSPAPTRACHHQELIDFMAGGEPCAQQEQQHLVPCLLTQCFQGKESGEGRRRKQRKWDFFFHPVCHSLAASRC